MDKTHRIRYIIGAGASANAIKTVVNFADLFKEWADFIKGYETLEEAIISDVYDMLNYYYQEISSTFSVDTLARLYWLQGDFSNLIKLKTAITLVLNLEQQQRRGDKRYDVFLSSLIHKEGKRLVFPKNIQIVSWNYDYQVEKVLSKISKTEISGLPMDKIFEPTQFMKLNGSVIFNESFQVNKDLPEETHDFLLDRLPMIKRSSEVFNSPKASLGNVKFSWEDPPEIKDVNTFAPDITVVIGYSFPTFNREVDMKLFDGKHKMGNHKIYIQCNSPNSKEGNMEVKSKLLGMGFKEQQIQEVDSSNEFLVPFEFNFPKKRVMTVTTFGGNRNNDFNRL